MLSGTRSQVLIGSGALKLVNAFTTTSISSSFAVAGSFPGCVIALIRLVTADDPADDNAAKVPTGYESLRTRSISGELHGSLSWRRALSVNEPVNLSKSFGQEGTPRSWFFVFSGGHLVLPAGSHNSNAGDARTATFPALAITNPKSFVVGAIQVKAADETPGAVAGTTVVGAGTGVRGFYSGPLSSWAQKTINIETSGSPGPGQPLPDKKYVLLEGEIVSQ